MADPDPAAEGGANARLDDTVAQTGPGIPDDAASDGYDPVADTDGEHDQEEEEAPGPDTLFNGP